MGRTAAGQWMYEALRALAGIVVLTLVTGLWACLWVSPATW